MSKDTLIIIIVDENFTQKEEPVFHICEGYIMVKFYSYREVCVQSMQIHGVRALDVATIIYIVPIDQEKIHAKSTSKVPKRKYKF